MVSDAEETDKGTAPDTAMTPDPATAAFPLFIAMANDAQDALTAIRAAVRGAYNARLRISQRQNVDTDTPSIDQLGKAYKKAEAMASRLENLRIVLCSLASVGGKDVDVNVDDDNNAYVEVAHIVLRISIEFLHAQAFTDIHSPIAVGAGADTRPRQDIHAVYRIIAAQLHEYVVQYVHEAGWPAHAVALRRSGVETAMFEAICLPYYEGDPHITQTQVALYTAMLNKAVHSCTAVPGASHATVQAVSQEYVKYAKHVLSELDSGEERDEMRGRRTRLARRHP